MRIPLLGVVACALLAVGGGVAGVAGAAAPALTAQQAQRVALQAVEATAHVELADRHAGGCERVARSVRRCTFAWRQDGRRRTATVRVTRSGPASSPVDAYRMGFADVEITPAASPVDPFTPAPPSGGAPQVLAPAGKRYVTLGVTIRNVGGLPARLVEPRLVTTAGTVVAADAVPGCDPPPQVQPRHWRTGCLAFLVPAGAPIARLEIGRTPETGAWRR